MNDSPQVVTERFSSRYDLVRNAEVCTIQDAEAIMDDEMFGKLQGQFGRPLVCFVGGLHYHFKPTSSVPAGVAAVPERNHRNPDALLVQR